MGTKPLHIFKPGQWTTMAGERIEFSQADLQATARAFDPRVARAPLVVGHPATDDPAQGWVSELVANERGLFASPDKVDPAFAEAVRAGRYGSISAKFYRPDDPHNPKPGVWYLRHVGFLGAAAPGVKGLDDPEFAATEAGGVCFREAVAFSEWDDMANAGLWRSLREWFIGKFGQDEADRVVPQYQVQQLEQGAQDELNEARQERADPAGPTPAFSEPSPKKESTVTEEEAAQLRAQAAAQAQRIAQLEAEQASARRASAHAAHVAFCEGLVNEGRMLPAWRDVAVATLDHFAGQPAPVEFGEGEARAPLADGFKSLLAALPKQVEFSETATGARAAASGDGVAFAAPAGFAVDQEAMALHGKALAHQKAHGGSYVEAVKAVS